LVPATALVRFRTLVSTLRQHYAASAECQHRLNQLLQSKHELVAERDRVAPTVRSPWPNIAATAAERLRGLDQELSGCKAEIEQARAELAAVEAKRGVASELAGACKEYLLARGVPAGELRY
jgi:hypothetical protein